MNTATPHEIVWLVYDDECPVCRTYCRYTRIRETVGELRLVDARQPGPLMDEITAAGLDIDRGMVLKFKDVVYYGADALHMLSLLSTRSGLFNRVSFLLFGTRVGAQLLYPAGKALQNVLLKVLGIGNIKTSTRNAPPARLPAQLRNRKGVLACATPALSINTFFFLFTASPTKLKNSATGQTLEGAKGLFG